MPNKTHVRVVAYAPITDDPYTQIPGIGPRGRVEFIIDRILLPAADHITTKYTDSATVIRLFVAPEATFRNPAPPNATSFERSSGIPLTLSERNLVISRFLNVSKRLPNWLIIPGSICWGSSEGDEFHWFNTIPVIMDGRLLHLYHKQHDADNFMGLNGLYNGKRITKPSILRHILPGGQEETEDDLRPERKVHAGNWKQFIRISPAPQANSPFFLVDGRRLAVEICADFTAATSLRYYMRDYSSETGTALHIVLAAGVVPSADNYKLSVARSGGHFILNNSWARVEYASEIHTITHRTGTVLNSALAVENDATQIQSQRVQASGAYLMPAVSDPAYPEADYPHAFRTIVYPDLLPLPNLTSKQFLDGLHQLVRR